MQRLVSVVVLAGCAHDVVTRFPMSAPGDAGAIEVVLNGASDQLTVSVDDIMVVDREHSRRARIAGVPAGTARVRVATGGHCEAAALVERDLTVVPGMTTTLALPGPNPDHGCMTYFGLSLVAVAIEFVGLALQAGHGLATHVK